MWCAYIRSFHIYICIPTEFTERIGERGRLSTHLVRYHDDGGKAASFGTGDVDVASETRDGRVPPSV